MKNVLQVYMSATGVVGLFPGCPGRKLGLHPGQVARAFLYLFFSFSLHPAVMSCSSSNASLTPALSAAYQSFICLHKSHLSTVNSYIIITFTFTSIVFLLPVYIFILHLGFKQWRQQSFSTMAMSHIDFFTYHMVLFELLSVLASVCVCVAASTRIMSISW